MRRVSIAAPDFHYDAEDVDGFRAGLFRLGKTVGSEQTGISMYEVPPGEAICPYHYEYGEEEWLLVLEGRPTLRRPGGSEPLEPWDVVLFPPGPEGAHRVRNGTEAPVRVLMFSNLTAVGASVYPDSDKIGIWTGNDDDEIVVRRSSGVDYWDGEPDAP